MPNVSKAGCTSWIAACVGLLVLVCLSASGPTPRALGQPQPSLAPEGRVAIPGSQVLQPDEQVTFFHPPLPPTPTPAPGSRPTPHRSLFSATVDLLVENASDQRLFVLDDGGDFVVTAYGQVLVQLSTRGPAGFPSPGFLRLDACGADDAAGNTVRC
ncbi:MAG: hypothetical protein ACYDCQ_21085, partial [Dehalococcoidia bacterium]